MKKYLLTALILCLLLIGAASAAQAQTTTVMIYMCGTDIADDGLNDLKEVCSAKYGSEVNVLVLAGGTKDWTDSRLYDRKLNLFTISGGKWSAVTDWGSGNMGSADTLKRFVTYGWNNMRGDRNILILWDHGSSALYGVCFDEVFGDDGLTVAEIGKCMQQLSSSLNGFHLDIFGVDACLMACYEMAVTVAPYADYYVASEELEPWLGWYYTNWLTVLGSNPDMSTRDLACAIVDSYEQACNKEDPTEYLTLSVIDLSCMGELSGYVNSLSSTLTERLNSGDGSAIRRTIQSLYVFGSFDDAGSDMVDLSDFFTVCETYDAATVAKAREVLSRAVVRSYANYRVPAATGMSIFIPMTNKRDVASSLNDYSSDALSGYTGFVTAFANNASGGWTFASSSSPSYYGYDDRDDSFWYSAGNYSCGQYDYGSGYGYNISGLSIAGSAGGYTGGSSGSSGSGNTAGLVIAGSAGQGTSSGSAGVSGLNIAGGTGGQGSGTAVPAAASAVTTGTSTNSGLVIAGSVSGTMVTPVAAAPAAAAEPAGTLPAGATPAPAVATQASAPAGGYVYGMKLSDEDLHYLAYAELLLFADYSDESGYDLDELGRVRDTWVDWDSGTIYAVFDNTWPALGDFFVVMYEQSRTEYGRRCIIPIMLNGSTKTYLVVEYTNGSTEGVILGTSEGWGANGLPVRGVKPLELGDTITPIYPTLMGGDTSKPLDLNELSSVWAVYDDDPDFILTWDGTQTVYQGVLPAADYRLAFRLHDIFGGTGLTDFVTFSIAE